MRTDGRKMLGLGSAIGMGVVLIRELSLAGFALVAALLLLAALICAALLLRRRWRRLLDMHRTLVRRPPPDRDARPAPPEETRLWTGLIDPPPLGIVGRDDVV